MRPVDILKNELDRLDQLYVDVKDAMPDLQGKYHTKVPEKVGIN